jgi:YfiH family protein
VWRGAAAGAEVRFVGRPVGGGEDADREDVLAAVGTPLPVAWAQQVHSARVLAARPGRCGEGDALIAGDGGLALSVATADCVPVLIAAGTRVVAVHAGWRGIVAGVIPAAVARLIAEAGDGAGGPEAWSAWIGPAIGPCCYEVGPEVADRVAMASSGEAIVPRPGARPHLDLPIAVLAQLVRAGVGTVRPTLWCTRCEPDRLHSFRRDGAAAGRNLSFVWRARTVG